jgi:hypothetical protein
MASQLWGILQNEPAHAVNPNFEIASTSAADISRLRDPMETITIQSRIQMTAPNLILTLAGRHSFSIHARGLADEILNSRLV